MRRTLALTALALLALTVASCQTWTAETTPPQRHYVQPLQAAPPQPLPAPPVAPAPVPAGPAGPVPSFAVPPPPVSESPYGGSPYGGVRAQAPAPDTLDVRRSVLEKKAKLLTLEAQKLALEKSMRDLRAEIAAEEKKQPKKKAATKAKLPTVTQQVGVGQAPKADAEVALAKKLDAILRRLDRLEKRLPMPLSPGVPAP